MKIWEQSQENKRSEEMRKTIRYQSDAQLRGLSGIEARLAEQIANDPSLTAEEKLEKIRGLGKTSGSTKNLISTYNSMTKRITDLQKMLPKTFVPEDKAELQQALQDAIAEREQFRANNPELADIIPGMQDGAAAPSQSDPLGIRR